MLITEITRHKRSHQRYSFQLAFQFCYSGLEDSWYLPPVHQYHRTGRTNQKNLSFQIDSRYNELAPCKTVQGILLSYQLITSYYPEEIAALKASGQVFQS